MLLSALAGGAHAQAADPRLSWHTIDTPRFAITYHDPLAPLAQHLAHAAERANSALRRSLGYVPRERTLILLTDGSDDANGSASVLPRNEIRLLASAPDDLSPIGDYDDWIATLVTHEHTHVLHLDQVGGLPALVNALLGPSVAPNSVQPRWFIEGIATYEESRHSSAGRLRGTIFDMFLRMDALQGRLPRLDELSNDAERWPHGDLRYLYGSRFLAFIAERHGERALARIGEEYGRQAFPYGLNRVARRATGHTFVELYAQFCAEITRSYARRRDEIAAAGLTQERALTAHADLARAPRFLRDGRVVYFVEDGRRVPGLYTLEGELLIATAGEAAAAAHPDGARVVFSQLAPVRDLYAFHDLFALELRSGDSRRLSHGLRASQPDVSPDGREVAFVTQAAGSSQLEIAQLDDIDGTHEPLLRLAPFEQVYTPRYSPDGRTLAVSAWRRGGYRDILLVDRGSGAVRELTRDHAQDTGPTWSPDGRSVYFSSDRTGVANLYAFDLVTGTTRQITNLVAGAYQPVLSPDGRRVVYVGYASRGFGLHEIDLGATSARPADAYADTRPAAALASDEARLPTTRYQPLDSLLPRSYRVELQHGALGTELAIGVAGSDLVGFHHYALRVAATLQTGDPTASLRYVYGRSPLAPSVRVFREINARRDLRVGGEARRWFEDAAGATLALAYGLPDVRRSQTLSLDYTLVHSGKARPFGGHLDPNDPPPQLPTLGFVPSAGFAYRYSDVTRAAYDVSPSAGRTFGVRITASDPIMGRELHSVALTWEARQFLAMPLLAHHVLALRYAGGQAAGDPGRVGGFSLGGFADRAPAFSLYDFVVFGALPNLSGEALRGYPGGHRYGDELHHLQLEYRFPLLWTNLGAYTLPVYARRVWATVFTDVGDAFTGPIDAEELLVGSGAELFASLTLSYRFTLLVRLGFAYGFGEGGESQLYLHLGSPF